MLDHMLDYVFIGLVTTALHKNRSAKVNTIGWSFLSSLNKLIIGALKQKNKNRHLKNSKGVLQVFLLLIKVALTSLFFPKKMKT